MLNLDNESNVPNAWRDKRKSSNQQQQQQMTNKMSAPPQSKGAPTPPHTKTAWTGNSAEVIRGRQTAAAAAGFSNGPSAAVAPAAPPPQQTLPQNPQEAPHPPDNSVNPRSAGPTSKMGDLEQAMDRLGMNQNPAADLGGDASAPSDLPGVPEDCGPPLPPNAQNGIGVEQNENGFRINSR